MKREPPVDFVRHGAVSLPIRHSPVTAWIEDPDAPRTEGKAPRLVQKVYDSFYVDARVVGRGRLQASSVGEAKKKGMPVAKEIAKEGQDAIQMPPEDRRIYVLAKKALEPFKIAVDEGARRLAEILRSLDGVSFETVLATFKAGRQNLKIGAKTMDVYKVYLGHQSAVRGNSVYHIRDVKKWIGKYCEKFPGELIPITRDEIQGWLKGLGGKARNKNNARDYVIAFYNFAQKTDYLPKNVEHAAAGTIEFKDERKIIATEEEARESVEKIEFYTPEEMRKLLAAASEVIRPTFEFKAFSGIRTGEMVRFWWVFAKEREKIIQVPKEIAKLKFRTMPMLENLQRRLAVYDPSVKHERVCHSRFHCTATRLKYGPAPTALVSV